MSNVTKVKTDHCGLYIQTGGYICRPFFGTCFKEGDQVVGHHFGGSTNAGVGLPDKAYFRDRNTFEFWSTTGCAYEKDKQQWKDPFNDSQCPTWEYYIGRVAQWYQFHTSTARVFAEPLNRKHARRIGRKYQDSRDVVQIRLQAGPSPVKITRLGKGLVKVTIQALKAVL